MARSLNKLSALSVKSAAPGKYSDGGGLWLHKADGGAGKWVFRFTIYGRRREMGLGSTNDVSLRDAREAADKWRGVSAKGLDPIKERERERREAEKRLHILREVAEDAYESRKAELKGDGKAGRWFSPLELHILPRLGKTPVTISCLHQGMNPTQATASVPGQVDALGGAATTANLVDPKDYASNVSLADQLTGISPTMTQSVSIAGMNPTTDISAPVSVNEYTGMLTNPGILSAEKLGMKPNQVKTVDVGLLNQPKTAGMGVVEGPVADGIQTPEAEVEAATTTAQTTKQPSRLGQFAKKAGASLIGGVAGGALGGPVGAMIGGMLAREAFGANNQQGGFLDGVKGLLGAGTGGQGAWAGIGTLKDLGQGAQASYGAWGGPQGTTGTATDGSRITNLGNGLVSRIDRYGRETFHKDGDTWGGGGGWGNSGGFLGGLFGGNSMGDGSRSQADKARDSVGLY